jgi:hypothetical protein
MREVMDQSYPRTAALVLPRNTATVLQGLDPQASEIERIVTQAYLFRLTYDSKLVWGRDLLDGVSPPALSHDWIRTSLESVRALVRYTAGLEKENRTDFDLPHDEALRLRKLARLGVLGGAHLLMAQGDFVSFRGTDSLPELQRQLPDWNHFLEETMALYIIPLPSPHQRLSAYLPLLVEWIEFCCQADFRRP